MHSRSHTSTPIATREPAAVQSVIGQSLGRRADMAVSLFNFDAKQPGEHIKRIFLSLCSESCDEQASRFRSCPDLIFGEGLHDQTQIPPPIWRCVKVR